MGIGRSDAFLPGAATASDESALRAAAVSSTTTLLDLGARDGASSACARDRLVLASVAVGFVLSQGAEGGRTVGGAEALGYAQRARGV